MTFIPTPTEWATIKRGVEGWVGWVAQIALNAHVPSPNLVEDGIIGPKSDLAIRMLQTALGVESDGVMGPRTQLAMCLAACKQMEYGRVPARMLEGIVRGESGGSLCAVSKQYPDESYDFFSAQENMLHPTQEQLRHAASPQLATNDLAEELVHAHTLYQGQKGCTSGKMPILGYAIEPKAAWCMAVLHYNWPAAAGTLAYGHDTAWLEKPFDFIPQSVKDKGVITGLDWAEWYVTTKITYVSSWGVAK